MSEDPAEKPSAGGAELPADVEHLFELTGPGWTERLRAAHHAPPPLGRLGPYELLGEVGRGGQGEVYKALQPGTGRVIAIKRVAGLGLVPDAAVLSRFTREVEALARMSHPNVVTVHSLEVIDGHSILVMEYVDGLPIDRWSDERWARGVEPLREVARAFLGVCAGVSHAHQRGVIHRDIKPSNILVDGEGRARVLDFGIARLRSEQAAAGAAPVWTMTGFAGTPAYASPEQVRAGPEGIDTRTDVYSLGVLLFRMLTGEEAFATSRGIAELLEHASRGLVRAPSRVRRGLPGECDWVVRQATDPDPARRYQTVDALADDIRLLLDGGAVRAHPPSGWYTLRRAVQRRPWAAGGIAVALTTVTTLGTLAAVQALRLSARTGELRAALAEAKDQRDRAEREGQRLQVMSARLLRATVGAVNNETYFLSNDPSPLETLQELVGSLTAEDSLEVQAELRMRLGFAYYRARRNKEAEAELAAAQIASEVIDDPSSQRAVWIVLERCRALHNLKRHEDHLREVDRAIARAAGSSRTLFSAMLFWSRLQALESLDRPTAELASCAEEAVSRCDEHADRASERSRCRETAAAALFRRGDRAAAERLFREALELGLREPVDARAVSRFQFSLGYSIAAQGRYSESEAFVRRAAESRAAIEGYAGSRGHSYARYHADLLLRLGRHREAAERYQQALVRPMAAAKPDARLVASLHFRRSVALFGAGKPTEARLDLAQGLSLAQKLDPEAPEIATLLERVELALNQSEWKIDNSVERALGDLSWLAVGMRITGDGDDA